LRGYGSSPNSEGEAALSNLHALGETKEKLGTKQSSWDGLKGRGAAVDRKGRKAKPVSSTSGRLDISEIDSATGKANRKSKTRGTHASFDLTAGLLGSEKT